MQMHCHPSHRNCHCPPCRPGSLVVFSSLFYFILYSIFCFSNSSPDLSSCCYSCTLDCTSHAARCTRHLGLLTIGHRPHSTSLCRINNILEKKKKKKQASKGILKEWVLYPVHLLHLHMHPRRRYRVSQHPSTSATSTPTSTMTLPSTSTPTPTQTNAATKLSPSPQPPTAAKTPVHHQAQSQGSSSAASPASSSLFTYSTCR